MRKPIIGWTRGFVLLGAVTLAGPLLAQTAAGGSPSAKGAAARASQTATPTDTKAAEAACNSRKGADQKSCLDAVRAGQRPAQAPVAGTAARPATSQAVPAVQTQSSAVSATNVAPTTTGADPAPGAPAVPRK